MHRAPARIAIQSIEYDILDCVVARTSPPMVPAATRVPSNVADTSPVTSAATGDFYHISRLMPVANVSPAK